jgi:ATP-dependent exoDNAse (exonuclease V) beta subunit
MSLHLISASAGTGKTEKLSTVVADALDARGSARIDVEGLVAVTYTHKAEAELKTRIRQTLIKRGAYDEAQRLPLAYVGTVHAICKRLLGEFALAAGLSPEVDVLPETSSERAINEALESALDPEHLQQLDTVCRRLRPNWDAMTYRYRWIPDAEDLIELARSNRIAPTDLPKMATRSIEGLRPLLGRRCKDTQPIDDGLRDQIDRALAHLGDGDGTDVTKKAIVALQEARKTLKLSGELPWATWAQLARLSAAVAHKVVLADVQAAAARHREHPRFHDDVTEYIRLLYQAVEKGLGGYTAWKDERRYIDYVDMEERALDLLDRPEVAEDLRGRLALLVVDEFQDTSPIQLALFLKIEELCRRSVWVGDRKQSIFAFRGADPALMDAVIDTAERAGNPTEVLSTNYRSRRALVDFTSELFAAAFAPQGYQEKQVRVTANRDAEGPQFAKLPPLGLWLLETTNAEGDAEAIAEGVRLMLATPTGTPVVDRATGEVRDVRASDVAILAATNDEATRLAKALGTRGILAVVPRKGLLDTPEGTMVHAALRVVADPRDSVARAHLDALDGFDGGDPEQWLARLIEAKTTDRRPAPSALVAQLDEQRARSIQLSPMEAVDDLIGRLDLGGRCARWPRPEERLANLEAFRALAAEYESECDAERTAGSIVGFLHFLGDAAQSSRPDSDRDRRDDQHAGGANAVEICTYHRAKGLEWPIVILSSLHSKTRAFGIPPDASAMRLERGGRSQLFSAVPESDAKQFDAKAPLAGRWLRFWPWPYGGIQTTDLVDQVAGTPESRLVVDAAARESLRLLYVGFTRARDHLILAARAKKKKIKAPKPKRVAKGKEPEASDEPEANKVEVTLSAQWLNTIHDGTAALLDLPSGDDLLQTISIRGPNGSTGPATSVPTRVWWLTDAPPEPTAAVTPSSLRRWYQTASPASAISYAIAPSRAVVDWPDVASEESVPSIKVHTIGGRLPFATGDQAMNEIGNTVHAFFAADPLPRSTDQRRAVADRILRANGFASVVSPEDLVAAHDRLRDFLSKLYPGAVWHREVPVAGKVPSRAGSRQVTGSIDLLLEAKEGWVVVDHKTYPGTDWEVKARTYAPQLAAYRRVLSAAGTRQVVAQFVHFPIGGRIAEVGGRTPK